MNSISTQKADSQPNLVTQTPFEALGLPSVLLHNLHCQGLTHATPIQAQTLPLALSGTDVAGQAHTGTGKTAAFLLAVLNTLLTRQANPSTNAPREASHPRALIIAPTRELADQIHQDVLPMLAGTGLTSVVCYGGTGYKAQRRAIADGVDILIGTPGRLIDYYKQKVFTLQSLEIAVLDEADRMFDLGFIEDIRYLFRKMTKPGQRQNLLFSATLSHRVLELGYEHMNAPTLVRTDNETVDIEAIQQYLFHVPAEEKMPLLIGLLQQLDHDRVLIFTNTRKTADNIQRILNANELPCAVLSGDVAQKKRLRLLNEFKSGQRSIMVATDIAARGLHVPNVSHVINYDLPQNPQDYVHRIGRTARAGQTGEAISLACEDYVYSLPDIEAYIEHKIESRVPPESQLIRNFKPAPRPRSKPDRNRSRHPRRHSRTDKRLGRNKQSN